MLKLQHGWLSTSHSLQTSHHHIEAMEDEAPYVRIEEYSPVVSDIPCHKVHGGL